MLQNLNHEVSTWLEMNIGNTKIWASTYTNYEAVSVLVPVLLLSTGIGKYTSVFPVARGL